MQISAASTVGHYENFPVASKLISKKYRQQIISLYRFARAADDIADEGDANPIIKLKTLKEYLSSFESNYQGKQIPNDHWQQYTKPMAKLCQRGLPIEYPQRLIKAFSQDTFTFRYSNMISLLKYCEDSANPVGRSVLYIYNQHTQQNILFSDEICSALQLINFWQDINIDWQKGRIYIPAEYLQKYGFSEDGSDSINNFSTGKKITKNWQNLIQEICEFARNKLLAGKELPKKIGGRQGWELKLVIAGGLTILDKIDQVAGDVFNYRPQLQQKDWLKIVTKTLFGKYAN